MKEYLEKMDRHVLTISTLGEEDPYATNLYSSNLQSPTPLRINRPFNL